jgi:hypothetical protein
MARTRHRSLRAHLCRFGVQRASHGWSGPHGAHTPMRTHTHTHTCTHAHARASTHARTRAHAEPYTLCVRVGNRCTHTYAHIHTWVHPHKHPYMHYTPTPRHTARQVGTAPYTCNVANVSFLEAAHPTEQPDTFRVRTESALMLFVHYQHSMQYCSLLTRPAYAGIFRRRRRRDRNGRRPVLQDGQPVQWEHAMRAMRPSLGRLDPSAH